jgi:hypothetical protein
MQPTTTEAVSTEHLRSIEELRAQVPVLSDALLHARIATSMNYHDE